MIDAAKDDADGVPGVVDRHRDRNGAARARCRGADPAARAATELPCLASTSACRRRTGPGCGARTRSRTPRRPDGLLRLHVRAVSGGLVSPILVHQVRAGDPLVLGAPGRDDDRGHALVPGRAVPGGRHRAGSGQGDHRGHHQRAGAPRGTGRSCSTTAHGGIRTSTTWPTCGTWSLPTRGCRSSRRSRTSRAHDVMYGTVPELAAKATWADRDIYISGPDHDDHQDRPGAARTRRP